MLDFNKLYNSEFIAFKDCYKTCDSYCCSNFLGKTFKILSKNRVVLPLLEEEYLYYKSKGGIQNITQEKSLSNFHKSCYIISMNAMILAKATNILKNAGCTEIYLFGSQATGKANDNSDVDLGVKGLPPKLFFRMHSDLEEALKMPVDLVDFDYQKDFFDLLQRVGELKKIG